MSLEAFQVGAFQADDDIDMDDMAFQQAPPPLPVTPPYLAMLESILDPRSKDIQAGRLLRWP